MLRTAVETSVCAYFLQLLSYGYGGGIFRQMCLTFDLFIGNTSLILNV